MTETTTRCCTFRLDPGGFVRATMHEGAEFSLADAKEALEATWLVAGKVRRGVLVDMRGVRSQTREAREHFVSSEAFEVVRAAALLVGSPLSRMIGNFSLRMGTLVIPTRLFTTDAEAVAWLADRAG